jgi:hypothetical protein
MKEVPKNKVLLLKPGKPLSRNREFLIRKAFLLSQVK